MKQRICSREGSMIYLTAISKSRDVTLRVTYENVRISLSRRSVPPPTPRTTTALHDIWKWIKWLVWLFQRESNQLRSWLSEFSKKHIWRYIESRIKQIKFFEKKFQREKRNWKEEWEKRKEKLLLIQLNCRTALDSAYGTPWVPVRHSLTAVAAISECRNGTRKVP